MTTLYRIWEAAQAGLPDYHEQLLAKSLDGGLQPIQRTELMQLISESGPGDSFQVGGLNFQIGDDGVTVHVTATTPPVTPAAPQGKSFGKSAGQQESSGLGQSLLDAWKAKDSRRVL